MNVCMEDLKAISARFETSSPEAFCGGDYKSLVPAWRWSQVSVCKAVYTGERCI